MRAKRTYAAPGRLANAFLIPFKANRVLHLILIGILLIALRVWHLSVIQHKSRVEEALRPQHKTIYEPAKRGSIVDRFGVPLAINKVQYNVAILYSHIKQVPSVSWVTGPDGTRVKEYRRRDHIKALAEVLARELDMDADRVEDLIHAKASFYNQIPFVLRENISEKQYYRLKILEKDWLGIQVQTAPRRFYPQGNVAGDILGYIGPINREEYETIIGEIKALERAQAALAAGSDDPLPDGIDDEEHLEKRRKDLLELAYSINDIIGKTGIEGQYERELRGFRGQKKYFANARGKYLKGLSGNKPPLPGNKLVLTISSELQKFAEELLIENESIRQTRLARLATNKKTILAEKQPWIKGGAIVVMNPNNGEVYAMASHPHFNPNDFIAEGAAVAGQSRKDNLLKWLESDAYIADIWEGQRPWEREVWTKGDHLTKEAVHLSWDRYLEAVLGKESFLLNTLKAHNTVEDAVRAQREYAANPTGERDYDQLLMLDLYRLAVDADRFTDALVKAVGRQTLAQYKEAAEAMTALKATAKTMAQQLFHDSNFKAWREENEKSFLKGKREEEKARNIYAKPYIDYLDAQERRLFSAFWEENSLKLLAIWLRGAREEDRDEVTAAHVELFDMWHQEIQQGAHHQASWYKSYSVLQNAIQSLTSPLDSAYLATLRSFYQLDRPLLGKYKSLRRYPDKLQVEKHLAAGFYPKYGYGCARSCSYRQSATLGSIFKLVTSYAALIQQYNALKGSSITTSSLNPLEMIDTVFTKGNELFVGFDADGKAIPRYYKGGRLPKSAMAAIGRVDLLKAIETSSNPYFSLLAGNFLKSPQDLANAARALSLGHKTGIELPGEITGNIPQDLDTNRTGLYSFAIGQHTLVVTPLQAAVMLSTIANGGKVYKPMIVAQRETEVAGVPAVSLITAQVKRQLFMPDEIRKLLVHGMCRVVARSHQESLRSLSRLYHEHPEAIHDYVELKYHLAGKTSTAESIESIDLDAAQGTNIYTHVWFGGILYDKPIFEEPNQRFVFKDAGGAPELVVVVYLRYGGYGKEAAPIAAQVAKKWRSIKSARKI